MLCFQYSVFPYYYWCFTIIFSLSCFGWRQRFYIWSPRRNWTRWTWQIWSLCISKFFFHPSGTAPSELSETPRWRNTPRPASIQHVTLHIALWSVFHRFFSFCRSPILNDHSGVVANSDHTSELVDWVRACIGIAMRWVTLRKSLLAFLLHARKMGFSLY